MAEHGASGRANAMTMVKWLILIAAATVLQTSALLDLNVFGVTGVKPDLFLILTIAFSLGRGKSKGEVFGFLTGLLQDSLSSGPLGANALTKTLVGYLAGRWRKQFFWKNLPAQVFLTFVFSLVSDSIYLLLNEPAAQLRTGGMEDIAKLILCSAVFNSVLSPLVFFAAQKFGGSAE